MFKYTLIALLVFGYIYPAHAYVLGGSNLTLGQYPEMRCRKPFMPFGEKSQWMIDQYNIEVEQYVRRLKTYLENAENDIKRIEEAAQNAVDEARREN